LVGSAGEYELAALQRQIAALQLDNNIKDAQIKETNEQTKETNEQIKEIDDENRSLRHENEVLCSSVVAMNSRSMESIFEECLSNSSDSSEVFQGVQRQVLELQMSHDIKMKLMKQAVHEAELKLALVRGSQDVTDLELFSWQL
jgi:septal ring factor EnvC (AmiA/AmiB activator)